MCVCGVWVFFGLVTSEMRLDEMGQHLTPGGPVVVDIGSPDIQRVGYRLAIQYFGESSVRIRIFVVSTSGGDDDPAVSLSFEYPVIVQVWNIMLRGVEIHLLVEETTGIIRQVVDTAHGDGTLKEIGSF